VKKSKNLFTDDLFILRKRITQSKTQRSF